MLGRLAEHLSSWTKERAIRYYFHHHQINKHLRCSNKYYGKA